jgi:hypothetical protein
LIADYLKIDDWWVLEKNNIHSYTSLRGQLPLPFIKKRVLTYPSSPDLETCLPSGNQTWFAGKFTMATSMILSIKQRPIYWAFHSYPLQISVK